jgi:hypothetical protein
MTAERAAFRCGDPIRTIPTWNAEATQLMLEATFEPRYSTSTTPYSERTLEKKRKKTPEERVAERAYRKDLDRRLLEMIERYRKLNARRRAEGQTQ